MSEISFCDIEAIGMSIRGEDAKPLVDALNAYLSAFAAPPRRKGGGNFLQGELCCPNCGKSLCGAFGTFTWGIAFGEGECSNCGWPCRGIHNPKDADGIPIFNRPLEIVLPYHPSYVEKVRCDG